VVLRNFRKHRPIITFVPPTCYNLKTVLQTSLPYPISKSTTVLNSQTHQCYIVKKQGKKLFQFRATSCWWCCLFSPVLNWDFWDGFCLSVRFLCSLTLSAASLGSRRSGISFTRRCPEFHCRNLRPLGFPFTNKSKPECGVFTVDCGDQYSTIQLEEGGRSYQVLSISPDNTIRIFDIELWGAAPESFNANPYII
jgi:hypothetical protein